jgi:hypothetical protein
VDLTQSNGRCGSVSPPIRLHPRVRGRKRRLDVLEFVLIAGRVQVDVLDTLCEKPLRSRDTSVPLGPPQAMAGFVIWLQRLPKLSAVASDAKGSPNPSIDPSTGPLP